MLGVLGRVGGGQRGGALAEIVCAEQGGRAVIAGDHQNVEVVGEVIYPPESVHDVLVRRHEGQVESRHQPHGLLLAEPLEERVGIGQHARINDRASPQSPR